MKTYETFATVEAQGQVHVGGIPFAPGTEVEVTIKPAQDGGHATAAAASDRAARLFAALMTLANRLHPCDDVLRPIFLGLPAHWEKVL